MSEFDPQTGGWYPESDQIEKEMVELLFYADFLATRTPEDCVEYVDGVEHRTAYWLHHNRGQHLYKMTSYDDGQLWIFRRSIVDSSDGSSFYDAFHYSADSGLTKVSPDIYERQILPVSDQERTELLHSLKVAFDNDEHVVYPKNGTPRRTDD